MTLKIKLCPSRLNRAKNVTHSCLSIVLFSHYLSLSLSLCFSVFYVCNIMQPRATKNVYRFFMSCPLSCQLRSRLSIYRHFCSLLWRSHAAQRSLSDRRNCCAYRVSLGKIRRFCFTHFPFGRTLESRRRNYPRIDFIFVFSFLH